MTCFLNLNEKICVYTIIEEMTDIKFRKLCEAVLKYFFTLKLITSMNCAIHVYLNRLI